MTHRVSLSDILAEDVDCGVFEAGGAQNHELRVHEGVVKYEEHKKKKKKINDKIGWRNKSKLA
jgi:hypothetical protein